MTSKVTTTVHFINADGTTEDCEVDAEKTFEAGVIIKDGKFYTFQRFDGQFYTRLVFQQVNASVLDGNAEPVMPKGFTRAEIEEMLDIVKDEEQTVDNGEFKQESTDGWYTRLLRAILEKDA